MAYQVEYWRTDGTGHSMIRATRLEKFSEEFRAVILQNGTVQSFKELTHRTVRPADCTLITIGRTDQQSPWNRIIWEA